jgi:hypothetical protein
MSQFLFFVVPIRDENARNSSMGGTRCFLALRNGRYWGDLDRGGIPTGFNWTPFFAWYEINSRRGRSHPTHGDWASIPAGAGLTKQGLMGPFVCNVTAPRHRIILRALPSSTGGTSYEQPLWCQPRPCKAATHMSHAGTPSCGLTDPPPAARRIRRFPTPHCPGSPLPSSASSRAPSHPQPGTRRHLSWRAPISSNRAVRISNWRPLPPATTSSPAIGTAFRWRFLRACLTDPLKGPTP